MKNDVPYLRADIIKALIKETPPQCFHCGLKYEKDKKHCGADFNTWKPLCDCLSTTTIRIVTGGEVILTNESEDGEVEFEL